MYPFDMKRALAGEPVVTRSSYLKVLGVKIFHNPHPGYSLLVSLKNRGYKTTHTDFYYTEKGQFYTSGKTSHLDLFMKYPADDDGSGNKSK